MRLPLVLLLIIASLAVANAAVDCTKLTGCSSCSSQAQCGWCSFYGTTTSGSCMNATLASSQCSSAFTGTFVTTPTQCAAVNQTCADFSKDCVKCSTAPAELNCGYCADGLNGIASHTCVPGMMDSPSSGYCPYSVWGFGSSSCTMQGNCNLFNNQGCSVCTTAGTGCGYCSTTGRCETYTSTGGAPSSYDCDTYYPTLNWTTLTNQCPGVQDQCYLYGGSCSTCASAPGQYSCGWCPSTKSCVTGTSNGPLYGTCAGMDGGSSEWVPPQGTCGATCQYLTDCGKCVQSATECGWCYYNNQVGNCMPSSGTMPTGGYECQGTFETTSTQCANNPAPGPTPTPGPSPSPDPYDDGSYPAAGSAAIALMSVTSLFILLRGALYTCVASWIPRFGTRTIVGAPVHSSVSTVRGLGVAMALTSVILKLTALGLDIWDMDSQSEAGITVSVYFGVTQMRMSGGGQSQSMSYSDECSQISEAGVTGSPYGLCETKRVAGILTLLTGIFSVTCTVILFIFCCIGLFTPTRYTSMLLKMWRLSGLSALLALGAINYWAWSGHMIIHHQDDANATLGVSWILFIVSWACDIVNLIFFRRAISYSQNPSNALDSGFLPYAHLNAGQPAAVAAPMQYQPVGAVAYEQRPSYNYQPYGQQQQQGYIPPAYNPQQ